MRTKQQVECELTQIEKEYEFHRERQNYFNSKLSNLRYELEEIKKAECKRTIKFGDVYRYLYPDVGDDGNRIILYNSHGKLNAFKLNDGTYKCADPQANVDIHSYEYVRNIFENNC